jgi:hypothetical protein
MSITTHPGTPPPMTVAAGPDVTAGDQGTEEYRKGRGDGIIWACDYATADELRDLVEGYEPGRGGYFDNSHWRGFADGAQEVLDAISPLLTDATADDQPSEQYQRGRGDGIIWACDYATADELHGLAEEDLGAGRGGYFDNPHWRGFVAGAQEVLDAVSPLLGG